MKVSVLFAGVVLLHSSYVLHAKTIYGNDCLKHKPHTSAPPPIQHSKSTPIASARKNLVIKNKDLDKQSRWYIQVAGGTLFSNLPTSMTVDNGSHYPYPNNLDTFTINKNGNPGTVLLSVGRTFPTNRLLLSQYSVGVRYQHVPSNKVRGTITQYTFPDFLNYNYTWGTMNNALTADTKLNFFEWHRFSSYVNGGLGISANQSHRYTETALPGVTPRVSPGFSSGSKNAFTYHVGAGIDYTLTEAWRLSLGYEYINLGSSASGYGINTWSSQSLQAGRSQANTALLGVTYLIGSA